MRKISHLCRSKTLNGIQQSRASRSNSGLQLPLQGQGNLRRHDLLLFRRAALNAAQEGRAATAQLHKQGVPAVCHLVQGQRPGSEGMHRHLFPAKPTRRP